MEMVSVVIPVYNSEKTLEKVVTKTISSLKDKYKVEVILVNDGSVDSSHKLCMGLSETKDEVKYIQLSRNFGQHSAMIVGYRESVGDFVVSIDDDLQQDPSDIPLLIDEVKKGFDVVFAQYNRKKEDAFRLFGSFVTRKIASWLVDFPIFYEVYRWLMITNLKVQRLLG
ncbi:glycosyltransferase [archaeon]|nr:glycosyltransferase [archaeon]